jgi:hypothetical protein
MNLAELRAARRDNRRKMKTASGERLALRRELEAVLAARILKLTH